MQIPLGHTAPAPDRNAASAAGDPGKGKTEAALEDHSKPGFETVFAEKRSGLASGPQEFGESSKSPPETASSKEAATAEADGLTDGASHDGLTLGDAPIADQAAEPGPKPSAAPGPSAGAWQLGLADRGTHQTEAEFAASDASALSGGAQPHQDRDTGGQRQSDLQALSGLAGVPTRPGTAANTFAERGLTPQRTSTVLSARNSGLDAEGQTSNPAATKVSDTSANMSSLRGPVLEKQGEKPGRGLGRDDSHKPTAHGREAGAAGIADGQMSKPDDPPRSNVLAKGGNALALHNSAVGTDSHFSSTPRRSETPAPEVSTDPEADTEIPLRHPPTLNRAVPASNSIATQDFATMGNPGLWTSVSGTDFAAEQSGKAVDSELANLSTMGFTTGQAETSAPLRQSFASYLNSPDLPRHVVQQLLIGFRSGSDQTSEILLNPAELGRVRINLHTGESGVVISVFADRPETLDLMRRHADLLAQEFQDVGYGDAEFSFGQGNGSDPRGDEEANSEMPTQDIPLPVDAASPEKPSALQTNAISLDRVDIRL